MAARRHPHLRRPPHGDVPVAGRVQPAGGCRAALPRAHLAGYDAAKRIALPPDQYISQRLSSIMQALRPEDSIVATYREHGHALLRGVSAESIMCEMFGKAAGSSIVPVEVEIAHRPRVTGTSNACCG